VKNKLDNISIINEGLTVDGKISVKGKLIVKGVVKGNLSGEAVIIAKEGSICADTDVADLTIGGKFEGNLKVSRELTILSTGICTGRIECKTLVVESGGILNSKVNYLIPETPEK
jgi:cytoskeletal protein CcmA (bactofilin family)